MNARSTLYAILVLGVLSLITYRYLLHHHHHQRPPLHQLSKNHDITRFFRLRNVSNAATFPTSSSLVLLQDPPNDLLSGSESASHSELSSPIQQGEEESSAEESGSTDGEAIDSDLENDTLYNATGLIEHQSSKNHEIAYLLSHAEWVRPVGLPSPLPWDSGTSHLPSCTAPDRKPERMYIYNHPIRCLKHFRSLSGFLLFTQGHPTPNSVNPLPVVYTPGWHLSRSFGRWSARWVANPEPYPPTRSQVTMAEAGLYVMVFQNSWVYRGSVIQCHRYFAPGACTGLQEPISNFESIPPKKGSPSGDSVFVLCDRHCKGYYHWTHEQLPRLGLLYDLLIENPSIQITTPMNGMILQYLQLLGFNRSQVTDIYTKATKDRYPTVFYKTVYYPQPMRCGSVLGPQLYLIRKILLGRMGLPHFRGDRPVNPTNMIVVMADRTDKRQPRNAKNITNTLRLLYPAIRFISHLGLNVRRQIQLFNSADLVIGPHGANLGNLMWCRQGSTVLEYVPLRTGNLCYYQTAAKLDLQYRMLMLDMVIDTPHTVSVEEVARHVEDVRSGLTSCRQGSRWVQCPEITSRIVF